MSTAEQGHGHVGAPNGNGNARTHGLRSLQKAWSQLGNRVIDGRSPAAVALRKWRANVIDDLGGKDAISTQQEALIDLACKSKLLLDSVDTWLLSQPSLINKRKRALLPVVLQRQALADGLARYLGQLGLERRHKVKTVSDLLNGHDEEPQSHDRETHHETATVGRDGEGKRHER